MSILKPNCCKVLYHHPDGKLTSIVPLRGPWELIYVPGCEVFPVDNTKLFVFDCVLSAKMFLERSSPNYEVWMAHGTNLQIPDFTHVPTTQHYFLDFWKGQKIKDCMSLVPGTLMACSVTTLFRYLDSSLKVRYQS